MNPFFTTNELAQEHISDLRREAEAARAVHVRDEFEDLDDADHGVTVRPEQAGDYAAIQLLAALEGRHVPNEPMLVAEVGGEVLAALPLEGGKPLADPFRPTAHLVAMLELRARQLRRQPDTRRPHLFARLRGLAHAA